MKNLASHTHSKTETIRNLFAVGSFVLVTLWTVTQYIASQYSYDPTLGTPVYGTLYSPHHAITWSLDIVDTDFSLVLTSWFIGLAIATITLAAWAALIFAASRPNKTLHGHGSAEWATREDLEKAGLVDTPTNETSLIVGGFENVKSKSIDYMIHTGPESVLVYAPSRSGKGVSLVIPNLLCYEESVFVHDMKGELWKSTAGYRRDELNQDVLYHDPTSLEPGNARFNVLDEIRITEPYAVKDTQLIAEYLVPSSSRANTNESSANDNEHFVTSARTLLVGLILYELNKATDFNNLLKNATDAFIAGSSNDHVRSLLPYVETEEDYIDSSDSPDEEQIDFLEEFENGVDDIDFPSPILVNVNSVLATATDPNIEFHDYLKKMQVYENDDCAHIDVIQQIATEMYDREPREFSSVLSTMRNALSIYRDPILADATSRSDFKLIDLVENKKPMSLYMIVSASEVDRLKNYFGMLVNVLCRKLTEKKPDDDSTSHKLLLMLDEFSKLPPLPIIQESLDHFAGYGIKAFIVAQDVQTLKRLYGPHETLQSNCKVRIAFTPNKLDTAEMLSKMIGSRTVEEKTQNRQRKSISMIDSSISEAEGLHGRPLMTVDEIMQLEVPKLDVNERMIKPGAALVFVTGCRPIKGIQTPYFMDIEMNRRSEYTEPMASDLMREQQENEENIIPEAVSNAVYKPTEVMVE